MCFSCACLPFSVKSLAFCACPQSFRRRPRWKSGERRKDWGQARATAEKGRRARWLERRPARSRGRDSGVRVFAVHAGATPAAGRKRRPEKRTAAKVRVERLWQVRSATSWSRERARRECRRAAACGRWRRSRRHLTVTFWGWGSPERSRLYVAGGRDFSYGLLRISRIGRVRVAGGGDLGRTVVRPHLMAAGLLGGVRRTVCDGRDAARPRARDGAGRSRQHPRHGRTIRASATRRLGEQARAARTAHVS